MAKQDKDTKAKIGDGHFGAMARLGLKELRQSFYPESNIAQPSEYGLYGTKTPGEVADARKSEDLDRDEEPNSILGERLEQAKSRENHERDSKDLERG